MNPDQLQELKIKLAEIKTISQKIKHNTFTRKTKGGKYQIRLGYASAVRRPVQDILNWISRVEQMLEIMLDTQEEGDEID